MNQRINIEKLLKWAYCEELPKAGSSHGGTYSVGSSWTSISSFAELLTKVDDNEYGVVPSFEVGIGEPHPDALAIHAAVCRLNELELTMPDDWNPMPEIEEHEKHLQMSLQAARFGIANAKRSPADLVRKHAILGGFPDWVGEVPVLKPVCNSSGLPIWFQMRIDHGIGGNGQPVENKFETEDGWNRNTKAPKAGAYQKFFLTPDPTPVIIGRGEYQIWVCCLNIIVEELAGKLDKWKVETVARPTCPWEAGGWRGPRVLEDVLFFS